VIVSIPLDAYGKGGIKFANRGSDLNIKLILAFYGVTVFKNLAFLLAKIRLV
jgi:hypothetical protein